MYKLLLAFLFFLFIIPLHSYSKYIANSRQQEILLSKFKEGYDIDFESLQRSCWDPDIWLVFMKENKEKMPWKLYEITKNAVCRPLIITDSFFNKGYPANPYQNVYGLFTFISDQKKVIAVLSDSIYTTGNENRATFQIRYYSPVKDTFFLIVADTLRVLDDYRNNYKWDGNGMIPAVKDGKKGYFSAQARFKSDENYNFGNPMLNAYKLGFVNKYGFSIVRDTSSKKFRIYKCNPGNFVETDDKLYDTAFFLENNIVVSQRAGEQWKQRILDPQYDTFSHNTVEYDFLRFPPKNDRRYRQDRIAGITQNGIYIIDLQGKSNYVAEKNVSQLSFIKNMDGCTYNSNGVWKHWDWKKGPGILRKRVNDTLVVDVKADLINPLSGDMYCLVEKSEVQIYKNKMDTLRFLHTLPMTDIENTNIEVLNPGKSVVAARQLPAEFFVAYAPLGKQYEHDTVDFAFVYDKSLIKRKKADSIYALTTFVTHTFSLVVMKPISLIDEGRKYFVCFREDRLCLFDITNKEVIEQMVDQKKALRKTGAHKTVPAKKNDK